MMIPEIPENEAARLQELHRSGLLDTPADPDFDDISELARRIAGTEIAILSLVDGNRQWFKSCVGAPLAQTETPRSISFCGHTILQRDPLIILDTKADPRFADNPLVTGEPGIRFYAGFPLITADGYALGSLCAISRSPHQLSREQIDSLRRLASLTVQHIAHLRQSALRDEAGPSSAGQRVQKSPIREGLSSLEQLMSRDQLMQMIELGMAMQMDSPFALLRCRFRDYDRVNATLGGLIAEEFINEGARRVLAAIPRGSSVARLAESELVVLLPFEVAAQDVERVAARILGFTNQPYRTGVHALAMGLAIGIAVFRRDHDSVEALLADTSMAVRMALRSSGSAFRVIDPETRVDARESYRLESDLREALQKRQLECHLQPIMELGGDGPVGFEALARWRRDGELVRPSDFIPMLSEGGVTGELDLLIIEKALAAIPLLALEVPQRRMTMSVNLSGILLEDSELRGRLLRLIEDNPLPMGWTLQVELLEDAFQDTSEAFDRFLADLVERSVEIAIDDFGTGYSSLARLLSLPIQVVKVDRAFVSQLDGSDDSPRTLLRTMLSMLRDLGLRITAEGVETASQRDWLLAEGVTRVQGFLFHQPLPIDEAIALLHRLDHRPGAIPIDTRRLEARRRWRWPSWRLPFL
jgi:diguanylate cyclase